MARDTIYALSSGQLPSGIAVIRVSGPKVPELCEVLAGSPCPPARQASLRSIRSRNGELLDRGLVLLFPFGESVTGEDLLEFHLHGGPAVVTAVMTELIRPGVRLARPGEFTERAFLNGRIDLTRAEAIADLIEAQTEGQRRQAVGNLDGRQARLYEGWRQTLLESRALIEAELDFSDEEDIPGSVSSEVWREIKQLQRSIDDQLDLAGAAEIIREGFRVAIVGPPNAGKSSLLNALASRDVAIVTPIAGTTRDLVEVALDFDGYKIVLTDTAGLRETDDPVERLGVERAQEAGRRADLVVYLPFGVDDVIEQAFPSVETLVVHSKSDEAKQSHPRAAFRVSSDGTGLARLRQEVVRRAAKATSKADQVLPTRARHRESLAVASAHLTLALEDVALELRAEELRLASEALGAITGQTNVDELLGAIFSRFCIGK